MHNNLQHKLDFKQILEFYTPNNECLETLGKLSLALLVAPVATGRNTIIKELLKIGRYHYLVSDTTRSRRINDGNPEEDGVEYWFKSEEVVLDEIKKGNYLGPAVIHDQQLSGINLSEMYRAINDSKVAITDIDVQGAEEITGIKPSVINIFLLPPSIDEWMRRLHERGAMDDDEKQRRLTSAKAEIAEVINKESFKLFINDDLDKSVKRIDNYITNGQYLEDDAFLRRHAKQMLEQLEAHSF